MYSIHLCTVMIQAQNSSYLSLLGFSKLPQASTQNFVSTFNPCLKDSFLFIRWHLGNCKKEYLPNQRGFDTFFGYWSAAEVSTMIISSS